MANKKLGQLVKMAQGDDRSLRQYAKDSGVDVSIISKIENGSYVPKKRKIYQDLTSSSAAPRNGVTYEDLLSAAEFSMSYMEGVAAVESFIATLSATPVSMILGGAALMGSAQNAMNKKSNVKDIEKAVNDIQRFAATARGIIFSELAQNGIPFQINADKESRLFENELDTYLSIQDDEKSEHIYRYAYISAEDEKTEFIVKNTPRRLIEELVFLSPMQNRRVFIVFNNKDSYEYIKALSGNLSYRGNLSLILINTDLVKIEQEIKIVTY